MKLAMAVKMRATGRPRRDKRNIRSRRSFFRLRDSFHSLCGREFPTLCGSVEGGAMLARGTPHERQNIGFFELKCIGIYRSTLSLVVDLGDVNATYL